MGRYLVIEEPRSNKSYFYNFAIIEAEDEEEAESKYLGNIDVDLDKNDLNIFDLNSVEPDFFYYLEIDEEELEIRR